MMKISVLGTGLMGLPIAQRLLDQGYEVIAYNRTASKLNALKERHTTTDVSDAIAQGELLLLMLTDASAIVSLLQPHGDKLSGKTIVQMGTIAPEESRNLAQWVQSVQGDYLEAPVLGSIPEAKQGTLLIMGGAAPTTWERLLPVLQTLGEDPMWIGPVGSASALKLALNQMIGALTVGFAQSLSYLEAQQVDREKFMTILRASALYAPTFDKKLARMVDQNYANPNFPTKHLAKDLKLFADSAAPLGLELSAIQGLQAVVVRAIAAGWADGDYSALVEGVRPQADLR
jgi:3-hydroxyisobutyrate dehydrogenase